MKFRSVAALTAVAALALAGCSSAEDTSASPSPSVDVSTDVSASDQALVDGIGWSIDEASGQPRLEVVPGSVLSGSVARFIADGSGDAIEINDLIVLDYVVYQGSTGQSAYSTFDVGQGELLTFAAAQMDPVLFNAIAGKKVGSTFIFAFPDGLDAVFLAVEITGKIEVLDRAEGEAVEPAEGLPVVTLDETGKPSVDLAGQADAVELVAQTLIEGDGAPVELGQTLWVHYTGWLLDGTQFDSSWDRGAASSFGLVPGGLIDGWTEGLAGVPVGSQVLLVVPSDKGYGVDGRPGSIPGGATLVFVVDILAAH